MNQTDQKQKGIALIVLSSFFFALMSAFVSLAGDLPFFQKALFRNLISVIVAGCTLLSQKTPVRVPKGCRRPLAVRILCGLTAVFCNYYAIDHLPLANSNSLNKLGPFFAILLAALFLKERMSRFQLGCVGLALTGSMFLIVPNLSALSASACIGLLGGFMSGGAHVALRALRKNSDISSSVIVFLFSAFSIAVTAVPCLLYWTPMSTRQLAYLLLAGSSCAAAQYAFTGAYRYAAPKDISIYDSSQIIFSGILGYLLFRQIPSWTSMAAYMLIIAASVLLFVHYRREDAAAGPRRSG